MKQVLNSKLWIEFNNDGTFNLLDKDDNILYENCFIKDIDYKIPLSTQILNSKYKGQELVVKHIVFNQDDIEIIEE